MLSSIPQFKESPSQTAGPYVHIGLIPHQAGFDIFEKNFSNVLVGPGTAGERIRIEGRIFDGSGSSTRDIMVEIWQANAAGRYNHPADRQEDMVAELKRLRRENEILRQEREILKRATAFFAKEGSR